MKRSFRLFGWLGTLSLALVGCKTGPTNNISSMDQKPVALASATVDLQETTAQQGPSPVQATAYQEPALAPTDGAGALPVPATESTTSQALTLDGVIRMTLTNNPDLVTASEQIRAAEAALCRARSEFYPQLGISERYNISNNPVQVFMYQLNEAQLNPNVDFNQPGVGDIFQTQLGLQQNLYSGARRLHAYDAATAQRNGAMFQLQAIQNQLVFQAAEAFYRLMQAHTLVGVRNEAVAQVQQHLQIVQSRYRNGTAVRSDVLSVEVRLAEVRQALITAQNQQELAWSVLDNVVGVPMVRGPLPADVAPAPWTANVDQLESAVAEAQSQRAEVSVLASQRQAATEGVDMAAAGKRLRADLMGTYDLFTSEFKRGNDSYFLGLVLQLNLFDGGRTDADIRRATARVRELRARQNRLMLNIELEVRRAYLTLVSAKKRLEVASQAIGQAQESLREIEARYRGQAATVTQLIDSQVALSDTEVRQTNAAAEVEIARAALQRAVGRLTDMVGS